MIYRIRFKSNFSILNPGFCFQNKYSTNCWVTPSSYLTSLEGCHRSVCRQGESDMNKHKTNRLMSSSTSFGHLWRAIFSGNLLPDLRRYCPVRENNREGGNYICMISYHKDQDNIRERGLYQKAQWWPKLTAALTGMVKKNVWRDAKLLAESRQDATALPISELNINEKL